MGLAANQIGVPQRVFVYDCPDADGIKHQGHIVNPVLQPVSAFAKPVSDVEGCLSIPGKQATLARPSIATVTGQDLHGQPITITGTGALARCLCHETDHLNGIVYTDHLSERERRRTLSEPQ